MKKILALLAFASIAMACKDETNFKANEKRGGSYRNWRKNVSRTIITSYQLSVAVDRN